MKIIIDNQVSKKFPDIQIKDVIVQEVLVKKFDNKLDKIKRSIEAEIRKTYSLETLPENPIIKAYRNFFWRIEIDPTKIRPSGEALIRRILNGNQLPTINTVVDCMNTVSALTGISMSSFDLDKIKGDIILRFAKVNENCELLEKSVNLNGNEIVLADSEKILCLYPYRDTKFALTSENTKNIWLHAHGVKGVSEKDLINTLEKTKDYIIKFSK